MKPKSLIMIGFALLLAACAVAAHAQENYFVTYTHQMEEPGNLEVAVRTVNGFPRRTKADTESLHRPVTNEVFVEVKMPVVDPIERVDNQ